MKIEVRNKRAKRADVPRRALAVLVALCLVLGQMNSGIFVAYATSGTPVTIQVGTNVTAEISDGVLTLSGTGDTDDFTAETAPFKGYAPEIRALEIEEGVTYVGACLFYGLGELGGSLTLPGSIVGFGESAFSGEAPESSAHFSVIRNLFVSGEVVRPAQAQAAPEAEPEPAPDPEPAGDEPAEDPAAAPLTDGTAPEPEAPEAESPVPAQVGVPEPQDAPGPVEVPSEDGYAVEQIAQQEVASPETLFGPGQDGMVVCSDDNATFLQAALSAGFQQADATATVVLDDAVELELPLAGGQLTLPEPPEDTLAAHEGESFAGWTQAPGDESAPVLAPGDPLPANDGDRVPLYSVWNAAEPLALLAEPAPSADVKTVYVDQTNGDDENDGASTDTAVKTLEAAAGKLTPKAEGGSVETNRIVIVGEYKRSVQLEKQDSKEGIFGDHPVPATLTGGTFAYDEPTTTANDYPLYLHDDILFESIELQCNHIYANGFNLTIGESVNTKPTSPKLYLYGYGNSTFGSDSASANITVKSGRYVRINGYIRSQSAGINCSGRSSSVTVEGSAAVDLLVAGSANGAIENANVDINVKGGKVETLLGGNQGFNDVYPPYSGSTKIRVEGGEVDNLYCAGSGRNTSAPTFSGKLDVNVSGGKVKRLYGSGSAAYVLAGSEAKVSVTDHGEVTDLFAAGKGWETTLNPSQSEWEVVEKFGSFSGNETITVSGNAVVANIYASGEGYSGSTKYEGTKANAYLDGNVTINMEGGTVTGNVYGGGKGIAAEGYEQCARVTKDSKVEVNIAGGTVHGNVYGGGQIADIEGSSSVTISGGTVEGNVYGGGEKGEVKGSATVNVQNGTVKGSVFGGAYGEPDQILVLGGSTVNMTGGWVRGNVYGGSELSNDGADNSSLPDLVITNLVGGTVDGNVFGGGYKGIVNGSTHLHIGTGALGKCKYYEMHEDKKPALVASSLTVGKSVYAGGDYGGDGKDYNAITVKGTSHVYIDGGNYDTSNNASGTTMKLGGGVFGSGASCDAGSTRLVTLENYGEAVLDGGTATGATRTLDSIQRADRVVILNSHVQLIGQPDVANANQTAKYSLNRIGDHEKAAGLGDLGNGLVLQGASTLILDSPAMELAAFRSVDADGKEAVESSPKSILLLDTGTLLRVAYTNEKGSTVYGPVKGYTRLLAGNAADGYVYAAIGDTDGGFVGKDNTTISFTNVGNATPSYRYWKVAGSGGSNAVREAVLTARTLESSDIGFGNDGYSVAKGVIELPPADNGSIYTVKSVDVGSGLSLTDAAIDGQEQSAAWEPDESSANSAKTAISNSPLNTFGLFMKAGSGFESVSGDSGKVVTGSLANSQIGQKVSGVGTIPQIEFYLTYRNDGITASRDAGTVMVVLERALGNGATETTTVNVQIVTRTTSLSELEADLYATQAGSYTGKIIIPSGSSRELSLTGVEAGSTGLVKEGAALTDGQFSISMQPVKSNGWQSTGLMSSPYDLASFASESVPIGVTDSRYEAPFEFTLRNAEGFASKEAPDIVTLELKETGVASSVQVTLRIHWKESAVSRVEAGPGRQYDLQNTKSDLAISQYSAATAVFTLASLQVKGSWLELQKDGGGSVALPSGTEFTLLSGSSFYHYQTTGAEGDNKILLDSFASMGSNANLSGTLNGDVTVIFDFGQASPQLELDKYSLRLRADTSADSTGADFTLNNSVATASISGVGGLSRGTHGFTVGLQLGSDTRFANGTAVVLSSGDSEGFPEGTVFRVGEAEYYPVNGKVSIPLGSATSFVMDTTNTAGLTSGEHTLSAQVFPTGANAGNAAPLSAEAAYTVSENPSYSLSVTLDAGSSRIVKPGSTLSFTANYKASAGEAITVDTQEKADAGYEDTVDLPVTVYAGKITVTVPDDTSAGTYRLLFKLGDQEVPYNIIVEG
ncbi:MULTISPECIES: hypothetical protein [Gordonibacter]|uniref:hypothetical protein n=1 Tax=Gordonibacter TaxID=644652 RepID=UPI001D803A2A|nr:MULTISPECIES: hypothetical protein [Gordonibacter]MDN4510107.1 hypothetical protein [Gordonibacter sp. RACS_AR49]HJF62986.1 hypothetical protein [Gordonibacter urolithinfaciens]